MSRKVRRVKYELDPHGIHGLPDEEIAAILRGADDMIMQGGRNLLTGVLKGSRAKKILELGLDASPVYGFYKALSPKDILARIDWVILNGYLRIEYDYRLPLLAFTDEGWEIERETYARELLQGFDRLLEASSLPFDMSYLKDRRRDLIWRLLDLVEQSGQAKYIPLLEAWELIDYKKVRGKIWHVIGRLRRGIGEGNI